MKLERAIEQYRNGKPEVIVKGSEAQVLFALRDARKDVLTLFSEVGSVTEERDRIERNRDMWKGQVERQSATIQTMREALDECADYFDQRADAEYFPDSAIPRTNKEMDMLVMIRDVLGKVGA